MAHPSLKMSLLTMYNYTKYTEDGIEHTIFDMFEVPYKEPTIKMINGNPVYMDESPGVDKNDFIAQLLVETADLPLAYPEPETFETLLLAWNRSRIADWKRMYAALTADYNPIHNFDRNEEYTDSRQTTDTGSDTVARTGSDSTTQNGTSTTTSTNSGKDIVESNGDTRHSQVAYEMGMAETAKDASNGTNTTTLGSSNTTTVKPDTTTTYNAGTTDTQTKDLRGTDDLTHTGHLYGNIGVTTTQQMINEEIAMRSQQDMTTIIINEFKSRFCIMVY